ncbi:MAG: HEPN domain-containing protein [Elusimicrobia bacterium]|nr:HEPN domain-containing protein [Elusimicrobiota bacterium]
MKVSYGQEWLRKARADYRAAHRALADSKKYPDQAEITCFHAHQCIEKFLKALLAAQKHPVTKTHDLAALLHQLKKINKAPRISTEDIRTLNQYSVEIRYPGASATPAEAKLTVKKMRKIVQETEKILENQLDTEL